MSDQSVNTVRVWTEQEVHNLICEIITDLSPSHGEAKVEKRLIEDLGYHSLALMELAFSLEDEFELPAINEATARQILTIDQVQQHVLNHLRSVNKVAVD
jgi:acyl carrier protein